VSTLWTHLVCDGIHTVCLAQSCVSTWSKVKMRLNLYLHNLCFCSNYAFQLLLVQMRKALNNKREYKFRSTIKHQQNRLLKQTCKYVHDVGIEPGTFGTFIQTRMEIFHVRSYSSNAYGNISCRKLFFDY